MSNINIAVVGGGVYGTHMLKCFYDQQRQGRVNLVALADVNPDILETRKKQFGVETFTRYQDMLRNTKLDAIAIATPDHLHYEIIEEAVKHGVHILSQKPLDVNIDRTKQLISMCEEAGVLLYVDFHKRFDPAHIRLKQDIQRDKFGTLQYGYVHMEDKIVVPTDWLRSWAAKSSPSWFLGVHFYDLVYWLTGDKPEKVYAHGFKGKLESEGIEGAWDSIQAKVVYQSGVSITYDVSWILPRSFPSIVNQGIKLVGEEGIAEVDSQERGYFSSHSSESSSLQVNPYGALEQDHPLFGNTTEGYTFSSMSYFIDVVKELINGRSLSSLEGCYPSGKEALISTSIGCAVDQSLASGEVVSINNLL
ncbi:Gfo/Idh/MocA family oxidoreductase [Vibrio penaeicida]|uniref:Gfo/Idh/MocA family protein n=1 Tax=Vibrio penaeicida TaxID=104609 RepID=UPI0027359152|nr:Gfo/Idh/MocA family oxidoreductase [Vibrio penaeicida]MDP2571384.1 Gfo/Idh/MocA family oxidoreductase [Vibrio penaeicida]